MAEDDPSRASLGADRATAALFQDLEPKLRQALLAYAGQADIDDAIGETFLYFCANSDRILAMENPRGYLFKVARDRARGSRRRAIELPPPAPSEQPEIEPELLGALQALPRNQRVAVFLITGLNWRWIEVAEFLGLSISTVRNHHRRGLEKLRRQIGDAS